MRALILIIMLILLALSSLRGGVSGDYIAYKLSFKYSVDVSKLPQIKNFEFEVLYSLLQYVVKFLYNNYQFFVFSIACIVMLLQYRFAMEYTHDDRIIALRGEPSSSFLLSKGCLIIKKRYPACYYPDRWGSYFFTVIFVLWGIYDAYIIVVRSTIAVCICLYSVKFIEKNDWKRFLFYVFIACGFHRSAAIFLPAYSIYNYHSSLQHKIFLFVLLSIFLTIFIIPLGLTYGSMIGGIIEQKLAGYLSSTNFMAGVVRKESAVVIVIKAILNVGFIVFLGICLWKMHKSDTKFEGYFNLYIMGSILYLATLSVGLAFARLSEYYNIFQIHILLYFILNNKHKSTSLMNWLFIALYLTFRFTSNHIFNEKYVFFWE